MKLGSLILPKTAALAPMAGVADRAFREICAAEGACYLVGEMASSKGVLHQNRKTAQLLMVSGEERPCAVQLFGDDPAAMAAAAAQASLYGPDAIDINMGCPVPKVAGTGSGSALMKNPRRAKEIITAVRGATSLPVTVKIRTGWDEHSKNAVEIALIAQDCGADAVTVHGRTRSQMYAPPVDYQTIAEVKRALTIPVIGNGDVCDIESAKRMYETGCDLVMVGRGAQGNPWIFSCTKPTLEERASVAQEHARGLAQLLPHRLSSMRKHIPWYFKGTESATSIRREVQSCCTLEDYETLLNAVLPGR